jgi:hypothetical protein
MRLLSQLSVVEASITTVGTLAGAVFFRLDAEVND